MGTKQGTSLQEVDQKPGRVESDLFPTHSLSCWLAAVSPVGVLYSFLSPSVTSQSRVEFTIRYVFSGQHNTHTHLGQANYLGK